MRYVPNLIPSENRVLHGEFKGNPYSHKKPNSFNQAISWIIGCVFLFSMFAFIRSFSLVFIFGLLTVSVLPPMVAFLERTLRFDFLLRYRIVFCLLLMFISVPFINNAVKEEKIRTEKKIAIEKAEKERKRKENAEAAAEIMMRQDSLSYYQKKVEQAVVSYNFDEAKQFLMAANRFATEEYEKSANSGLNETIERRQAEYLFKKGRYKEAIDVYSSLLRATPQSGEILYTRAICYQKTGDIPQAVNDLKAAITYGNTDASKLHDKINPLRKRVAYYVTLCCDGTTSSSTGRGTCSHHGGVCNWNAPVYETYRKY